MFDHLFIKKKKSSDALWIFSEVCLIWSTVFLLEIYRLVQNNFFTEKIMKFLLQYFFFFKNRVIKGLQFII